MSTKKKFEIWPIAIIVVMGLFMSGVVFAVTIMVRNDVPLVSDDYYAQEIAYQTRIDKEKQVLADGKKPELKLTDANQSLELQFKGVQNGLAPTGKITFFRPSDPGKDFSMAIAPSLAGVQMVDIKSLTGGLWLVQLDWVEAGKSYYYEQQITI